MRIVARQRARVVAATTAWRRPKRTSFSAGRWLFTLSLLMVVDSASASSDVASGLTELRKCGDECTFWLDTNKTMFKTGGCNWCTRVHLNNFGIAKIAKGTVSNMPNLRDLLLSDNEITELEPDWLRNVPSVKYLNLDGNKIAKLKTGTFFDLPNLVEVHLKNNEITELEPHWVKNMPNLWLLNIDYNKIAKLKTGTFSDLPNLEHVGLQYNEIIQLEPGWAINVSPDFWVDFWGNYLGCVSGISTETTSDVSFSQNFSVNSNRYVALRCPETCTINTCYDLDNHVCLSCPEINTDGIGTLCLFPEKTYNDGVRGLECTVLSKGGKMSSQEIMAVVFSVVGLIVTAGVIWLNRRRVFRCITTRNTGGGGNDRWNPIGRYDGFAQYSRARRTPRRGRRFIVVSILFCRSVKRCAGLGLHRGSPDTGSRLIFVISNNLCSPFYFPFVIMSENMS